MHGSQPLWQHSLSPGRSGGSGRGSSETGEDTAQDLKEMLRRQYMPPAGSGRRRQADSRPSGAALDLHRSNPILNCFEGVPSRTRLLRQAASFAARLPPATSEAWMIGYAAMRVGRRDSFPCAACLPRCWPRWRSRPSPATAEEPPPQGGTLPPARLHPQQHHPGANPPLPRLPLLAPATPGGTVEGAAAKDHPVGRPGRSAWYCPAVARAVPPLYPGVLKVLEELRVPVDCIAGTSMGSLVGGARMPAA